MDLEIMINEVRKRSLLWDVKNKDYKNRVLLKKGWKEIADTLKTDDSIVKKKWKALRDNYRTELAKVNKKPKSGSGANANYQSKWKYYSSLHFLRDSLTPAKLSGNLNDHYFESQEEPSSIVEQEINHGAEKDTQMEENGQISVRTNENVVNLEKDEDVLKITATKKRSLKSNCTFNESQFLEIEKEKLAIMKEDYSLKKDDNFNFLMSLLPQMQNMSIHENLRFRMKVSQLLFETVSASSSSNLGTNTCTPTPSTSWGDLEHNIVFDDF